LNHRRGIFLVCLLAVVASASRRVDAHVPRDLVGTQVLLRFFEDRVLLILDLGYRDSWAQSEMIRMDADRNSEVSEEEADAYCRVVWSKKILRQDKQTGDTDPALTCKIDGKPVPLVLRAIKHEQLVGRVFPAPFTVYYTCEVRPHDGPFRPDERHEIEILDLVTKDEVPTSPDYLLPFGGHGNDPKRYRLNPAFVDPPAEKVLTDGFGEQWVARGTERLIVRFEFSRRLDELRDEAGENEEPRDSKDAVGSDDEVPVESVPREPGSRKAGAENRADPDTVRDAEESRWFAKAMEDLSDGAGFWATGFYLLMATLWGAGHAFTPGHGKTMVAAYLIGTRGRFRDAVILGVTTTFTHTVIVYIVGISVLVIANRYASTSDGALANRAIVVCMVVSGSLLCVMGLAIFWRRVRGIDGGHRHGHQHQGGHSHAHGHQGGHSHTHEHQGGHSHAHEHHEEDSHEHPGKHPHAHEHGEEHSHQHQPPDAVASTPPHKPAHTDDTTARPSLRELVALGFSGGLLPCPAGITVILIGLHRPDDLVFAILLLVFFSIGLGGVLVLIGVFLISGKMLVSRRGLARGVFFQEIGFLQKIFAAPLLAKIDALGLRFLRVVPAASCLFIAALGAFFVVHSIVRHPTEVRAILDATGL